MDGRGSFGGTFAAGIEPWPVLPQLHEVVFDLLEETLFRRRIVDGQGVPKLFEQLALFAGDARRDANVNVDVEIAAAAAVDVGNALVLEPELRAGLRAFRDLQLVRLFERGDFDLGAERGLRDIDRNGAVQVLLAALEKRVRLHLEEDVKVAGRAAVYPGLPFVGEAEPRAVIHAGRDVDLELALRLAASRAAAGGARIANDLTGAVAGAARAADGDEALLVGDLAAAVTGGAGGGAAAGLRARAVAAVASLHARHLDIGIHAENGFVEGDFEIVADVLAALRAGTPAPGASEEIAEAKEIAENVAEIGEGVRVEAGLPAALQSGVAVAVVGSALLRIAQDAIGFGRFLELFLRGRVVGMMIGVVLAREAPVGALDVRLASLPADT